MTSGMVMQVMLVLADRPQTPVPRWRIPWLIRRSGHYLFDVGPRLSGPLKRNQSEQEVEIGVPGIYSIYHVLTIVVEYPSCSEAV